MRPDGAQKRSRSLLTASFLRWLTRGGASLLAALCLAAIPFLVLEVRDRLDALERANSDNSQWVMMQAEVEVLRLQAAIAVARENPSHAQLEEVRRWFNILYSRVSMLEESPVYAPLIATPDYSDSHRLLRDWLDTTVPLIDGPDPALAASLEEKSRALPEIRAAARKMTLNALSDFAAQSDMNRESIASTLVSLAFVVGLLLVAATAAAIIMARQFTRSQAQARELGQTGARLATIVATSADAIVVTDRDGTITTFNPAAVTIFGLPAAQALGRNAFRALFDEAPDGPQQTALLAMLRDPATANTPLRIEIDARRADGRSFPAEVSLARARTGPDGNEWLVVAFVRDISDRRAAERDLTRALDRALAGERAKADFLAVMSHEMRTPLSGLMGSMELMRQTGLTPEQAALMDILHASGEILLGHVNSVLDISRAEAGAIRPESADFDLDRLVDEVIANQSGLATAAGNRLQAIPLSGPIGMVRGDRGRLAQILLNLVGNAVKFTRNGEITVETERLAPGAEGVPLVEFRVTDTGIGIEEADLDRIFDDFVTLDASYGRSAGGTGLGLGIARRLARAMGGEIGAESEPGEGSLFWLRLPLPPASGEAPATLPAALGDPLPDTPSRSILLVEDNPTNRFLLRRFLEAGGHRVTEAADGLEATAAAARASYDLILMDISMPRMDGIAATRAIRSGGGPSARTRILALTAHALPEEQARFRAAGMEATLSKPISQNDLLRAVAGRTPPPVPARDPTPLLDAATLADLTGHIGPGTARALIARLIEEADRVTAALARLDTDQDRDEVIRLCHQLSGSSGTFGTRRLRAILVAAESALKAGDTTSARSTLATLPQVWADTRTALDEAAAAYA